MTPISRSVSETELTVLKALWDLRVGPVRELQAKLNDDGHAWAYTTVQTLLNRLEQKGYVASKKVGRAFHFHVIVSRDQLLSQELGDLAERVCGGAALPLVMNLVQGRRFTSAEIGRFRDLLDKLESDGQDEAKSKRRPRRARKGAGDAPC